MALFRPYQRNASTESSAKASDLVGKPGSASAAEPTTVVEDRTEPTGIAVDGRLETPQERAARQPAKKDRPTPSRRQAEAARMERLHPTLTKKEQKAAAAASRREQRMRVMDATEGKPERVLLRNYIDSSWHIGEFTMPGMILLMAMVFGAQYFPALIPWLSAAMYAFLILILLDVVVTWQRFKRVLAKRLPGASTKGLMLYAMNRVIQIRRFRTPPPAIKRGDAY